MLLKDMLKYRNAWLGVAMIWIVFYHAKINIGLDILHTIKAFGYGGVDICLFASGAGCYFSLSANSDIGTFIKRRFVRLAPTYLCFIVFWLIYKFFIDSISLQAVLGNIFAIQNFTGLGQHFNWYISAIILFYFLAPYLKIVVDRASSISKTAFLFF